MISAASSIWSRWIDEREDVPDRGLAAWQEQEAVAVRLLDDAVPQLGSGVLSVPPG